jgi:TonB family protein
VVGIQRGWEASRSVAVPGHSGDDRPSREGYLIAVAVSAIVHVALVIFVLFIVPKLFGSETLAPTSYSIKIVDEIPAGDPGTRLPAINSEPPMPERHAAKPAPTPPPVEAKPTPPPPDDKNALALNSLTPTVSPTRTPTPITTPTPAPEPTETPSPEPTRTPRPHRTPRPTPRPTAQPPPRAKPSPRPKPSPKPLTMAKADTAPNVKEELAKVREQLLRDHLKAIKAEAAKAEDESAKHARPSEDPGSGPIVADRERAGTGMGIGPGHGSAGMLQDPGFVMYYQDVQDRIRRAWSFAGGNPDLTATVTFGINPDGTLNSLKVTSSSRDPAFDDSVARAIRAAAPFGSPPDKYRDAFARGVPAIFKLSELQSGTASDN